MSEQKKYSIARQLSSILYNIEQQKEKLEFFIIDNLKELDDKDFLDTVTKGLDELEKSISTIDELF